MGAAALPCPPGRERAPRRRSRPEPGARRAGGTSHRRDARGRGRRQGSRPRSPSLRAAGASATAPCANPPTWAKAGRGRRPARGRMSDAASQGPDPIAGDTTDPFCGGGAPSQGHEGSPGRRRETRSQPPGGLLRSQRPKTGWLGALPGEDGRAGPPPPTPALCAPREASLGGAPSPGALSWVPPSWALPTLQIYDWPDLEQNPPKPEEEPNTERPRHGSWGSWRPGSRFPLQDPLLPGEGLPA